MKKSSDQRANVKNPNNPAFKAAADNRSVQLNPDSIKGKTDLTPKTAEVKRP